MRGAAAVPARAAALLAILLAVALGAAACRSSRTRANLPTALGIEPGVTTRAMVLEAWGSPAALRDEPGGGTVYVYRRDDSEGWGFAVGSAPPMTRILSVSYTAAKGETAEFCFLPDGRLEWVRIVDREENLTILR